MNNECLKTDLIVFINSASFRPSALLIRGWGSSISLAPFGASEGWVGQVSPLPFIGSRGSSSVLAASSSFTSCWASITKFNLGLKLTKDFEDFFDIVSSSSSLGCPCFALESALYPEKDSVLVVVWFCALDLLVFDLVKLVSLVFRLSFQVVFQVFLSADHQPRATKSPTSSLLSDLRCTFVFTLRPFGFSPPVAGETLPLVGECGTKARYTNFLEPFGEALVPIGLSPEPSSSSALVPCLAFTL